MMKITKRQLRRIIKEQIAFTPTEGGPYGDIVAVFNQLAETTDSLRGGPGNLHGDLIAELENISKNLGDWIQKNEGHLP